MPHTIRTASIQGIEAVLVSAEIDSSPGIHAFSIVGLGDKAVQESQDRVNAAVRNSGYKAPRSQNRRYTLNLAPADLRKEGAGFDLPIALSYLLESRQIKVGSRGTMVYGELSLDGTVSRSSGVIGTALLARELGCDELIVPYENAPEAASVESVCVIGVRTLKEAALHISGEKTVEPFRPATQAPPEPPDSFATITGQQTAKRALIIAAAGGHNVLMKGPPGTGKTLLARSIVSILPPMVERESLEVARIYSSIGLLRGTPSSLSRPFRSPHHTASPIAIVGGGTWPRPGEISLAHRGVLFLDEFPEFPRNVLESLRQPLEDGVVTVSRASGAVTMPAKFLLIAAMNPCPCGNHGDVRLPCTCAPQHVLRYRKKVSGPLLDRMDLQVTVSREPVRESAEPDMDDLESVRVAVKTARDAQMHRLLPLGLISNSDISHRRIESICAVEPTAKSLLSSAVNAKNLSFRAYHRTLKVSRTIADLEGSPAVHEHHVAEALSLRVDSQNNA